jgi:GTP cyclohydrolase I
MIEHLGTVIGDQEKLEVGFRLILEGLGLNTKDSPHLEGTPERAARTWYEELCSGLTNDEPEITTFESDIDEMVMLQGIPIRSICAHHLLPFYGHANIAYIPGKYRRIVGVSKLSRIADYWARRPQIQEELTVQIADHLMNLLGVDPLGQQGGVGVIIKAEHMCMIMRGVEHESTMVTSALRGVFRTRPEARAELLNL